jgi:hypothetical protein
MGDIWMHMQVVEKTNCNLRLSAKGKGHEREK